MTEQERIDAINFERERLNEITSLSHQLHVFTGKYRLSLHDRETFNKVHAILHDAYKHRIEYMY